MTISISDFYDFENLYYEEDEWFDDHVTDSSNKDWDYYYYQSAEDEL